RHHESESSDPSAPATGVGIRHSAQRRYGPRARPYGGPRRAYRVGRGDALRLARRARRLPGPRPAGQPARRTPMTQRFRNRREYQMSRYSLPVVGIIALACSVAACNGDGRSGQQPTATPTAPATATRTAIDTATLAPTATATSVPTDTARPTPTA